MSRSYSCSTKCTVLSGQIFTVEDYVIRSLPCSSELSEQTFCTEYECICKDKFLIFIFEYPVFTDKYSNIFVYSPFTKYMNTNIFGKSSFQYSHSNIQYSETNIRISEYIRIFALHCFTIHYDLSLWDVVVFDVKLWRLSIVHTMMNNDEQTINIELKEQSIQYNSTIISELRFCNNYGMQTWKYNWIVLYI